MSTIPDSRHLANGWLIPSEGYIDQPYVVRTDDDAWLCVTTTGAGHEGDRGQHIIALRSTDRGHTWSAPLDVEPADGPEASYAVLLKTPYGRIYCFYNHNTDQVRAARTEHGESVTRVDSLGHYVFKYSDDHGRSWSARRFDVPVREFASDRENVYGGSLRYFWNVGRPLVLGSAAFFTLHKVGALGEGFFAQSEGAILRSDNILTERDPEKIGFATLPDGEIGLRTPAGGGRVAEEHSITALSDGSLFCVYRSVDGWPVHAYSRDGGRHWTAPEYLTYTPGGRRVKHPRAANFAWRCANGHFLYWFHNHGGAAAKARAEWDPYNDRNPAWLLAGREIDTPDGKKLVWSQPELLLYDDDPFIRMSYPDLIEEEGKFFITETQKSVGRVHEIAPALLDGLFHQWENRAVAAEGMILELHGALPAEASMPRLPDFRCRDYSRADYGGQDMWTGFTLDLAFTLSAFVPGQLLLDTRTSAGQGFALMTADTGALTIVLNDGRGESRWASDPGSIQAGRRHHLTVIIDAGPHLILFIVDGLLNDGGDARQFGWGRFSPQLNSVNGAPILRIAPVIHHLRLYSRALRVSEAVGNYRATTK